MSCSTSSASSSCDILVQRASKVIKEVYPDTDISKFSQNRIIFLHYIISASKRLCYRNNVIAKADPLHCIPGINPDDCDTSMLSEYDAKDFNDRWICLLCKHVPVDPISCKKCRNFYCRLCCLYLVRLQSASVSRELEKVLDEYSIFVCVHCDDGTKLPEEVDLVGDPIYESVKFNCNHSQCGFKAHAKDIKQHISSCVLKGFNVNISLFGALINVPKQSIAQLMNSYQQTIEIFRAEVQNAANSIAIAERPASPVIPDKSSFDWPSTSSQAHSTAVAATSSTPEAHSTAVAEPSPRASSENWPIQLSLKNISALQNSELLAGAILPKKLKSTSSISLRPKPVGFMQINDQQVTVVKASQIIGDRSHQREVPDQVWQDRYIQALRIDDDKKRRNMVNRINYRINKKSFRNASLKAQRQKKYAIQLLRFTPKLFIRYPFTDASKLTHKNIEICKKDNLKVIAMDIEGQTLLINKHFYRVPGSIGIVGNGGEIIVHDIIRWPHELLNNPDKPNYITGLDFKACQCGPTLAFARKKVAQALLDADRIILHGQAGDLKGLFFNEFDYDLVKEKIRDIGAYYNIRTTRNGSMSVQLATYLIFQEMIQGKNYHYAIQDAYFTLMLYYADMENIEDTYESCKDDCNWVNGYSYVNYPPNAQMASLYLEYSNTFEEWPKQIKLKKFGGIRRLENTNDDEIIFPSTTRSPPYNTPLSFFKRFYSK